MGREWAAARRQDTLIYRTINGRNHLIIIPSLLQRQHSRVRLRPARNFCPRLTDCRASRFPFGRFNFGRNKREKKKKPCNATIENMIFLFSFHISVNSYYLHYFSAVNCNLKVDLRIISNAQNQLAHTAVMYC